MVLSTTSMLLILGASFLLTAVLTTALMTIVAKRFSKARMDVAGDELAAKVKSAVTAAVEEALPRVREEVARGVGEAGEELLPKLRTEVEGGIRDAAEDALPKFREQVREGFSEAVASAVTGGVLGKAGEELVRKGGGVIDALLGSRRDEE
jgi:hypothetical protein